MKLKAPWTPVHFLLAFLTDADLRKKALGEVDECYPDITVELAQDFSL